jgi:hypothetical protein
MEVIILLRLLHPERISFSLVDGLCAGAMFVSLVDGLCAEVIFVSLVY